MEVLKSKYLNIWTLCIFYAIIMVLTTRMYKISYLPIISIGSFYITAIVFLVIHFIVSSKTSDLKRGHGFVMFYLEGWGLMLLSWLMAGMIMLTLSIIGLEEISIHNIFEVAVTGIPSLIGILLMASIKTLFLATIIPIYLVNRKS